MTVYVDVTAPSDLHVSYVTLTMSAPLGSPVSLGTLPAKPGEVIRFTPDLTGVSGDTLITFSATAYSSNGTASTVATTTYTTPPA